MAIRIAPFFALLAAIACSSPSPNETASRIFVGGVVIPMTGEAERAEAIALRDGKILAVGSDAQIQRLVGPETRVTDLQGRVLLPGFVDAHSHVIFAGQNELFMVDATSPPVGNKEKIADVIAALADRARQTEPGEWIVSMGYDDTLLSEGRHPTREDLDRASTEHAILAVHVSGHLMVANSMALELASITPETEQPPGGVIRKDAEGVPNGVLEEAPAFGRVLASIPPRSAEHELQALEAAARTYAAAGITTAQSGLTNQAQLKLLQQGEHEGRLRIRIVAWPDLEAARAISGGSLEVRESPMLDIGAVKLVADGSIQGYTGYLSEPYHVPPEGNAEFHGYSIHSQKALIAMVEELAALEWQIAIHGNGDAAIDLILAAYEQVYPDPDHDRRPIIIHSQMAREDQLDRMAALGAIPSFFNMHTYYWGDRHRELFMGPERAARMSPTQSAKQRGLRFTLHADTPIVPMEPLRIVWSATERRSTSGALIGPDQAISRYDALKAITVDAARQHFQEELLGSLEPGKLADLVVLSADPLDSANQLLEIQVIETVVGGETVFETEATG